jgi:hypothetical protein
MAKTRWLLAGIALESAVIFGFYASDKFQEDGTCKRSMGHALTLGLGADAAKETEAQCRVLWEGCHWGPIGCVQALHSRR